MKLTISKKRRQTSTRRRSVSLVDLLTLGLHAMWRRATRKQRRRIVRGTRPKARVAGLEPLRLALQPLEAREMLYGYIQAQNDPLSTSGYAAFNTTAYNVAAPGVLANDYDSNGYQMTAHLASNPPHGTVTFNGDGSFSYTANIGYCGTDSFTYYDTDTGGNTSNTATVSFQVYPGTLSDVDQTKLPPDTLQLPMQILGSSSGQPGTADNLSLVYHSSTAQPTQTLEQDFQPSMEPVVSDTMEVGGTFNGSTLNSTFVSTSNLSGNDPTIRLSLDVNTASLPTGRYADTQTVSYMNSMGPTLVSTLDGAANVVNDQSSPFGA
ncbi:MAG: Ig-like domain-containing protein, partial [Pirellulales bacterium]